MFFGNNVITASQNRFRLSGKYTVRPVLRLEMRTELSTIELCQDRQALVGSDRLVRSYPAYSSTASYPEYSNCFGLTCIPQIGAQISEKQGF